MDPQLEDPSSPSPSPRGPHISDDDVASGGYSSCDGSEFDRYCSANSAFGSASLCSSVGNHSELLDSFKIELAMKSAANSSRFKGKSVRTGSDDDDDDDDSEEEGLSDGSGSGDDESRVQFVERSSSQCSRGIMEESGSAILMNSLVAFGAGDWDDFEQETKGDGLGSLTLFEDLLFQQQTSIDHAGAPSVMENNDSILQRSRLEEKDSSLIGKDGSDIDAKDTTRIPVMDEPELTVAPLRNGIFEQSFNALNRAFLREGTGDEEIDGVASLLPIESIMGTGNSDSIDGFREDFVLEEENKQETLDSYDEMVLEMEEILLNSENSHGDRSIITDEVNTTQHSHHLRDGSSTASTSGTDDVYPLPQYPHKIDGVEVIGAKQKKGDVSFGERLVGVKEYTIYKLRVWSGKDQWEVERRYRDFFALYRQLITLFAEHGLSLPSSWSKVEQESRKIFGNASPNVISDRSILIQDCLRSILNSNYPFGTPTSLVQFLSPGQIIHSSGSGSLLKSLVQNSKFLSSSSSKDGSRLGKTISLVVEIKPRKSVRQLLEAQHYACAGCHRHFDAGKTLIREIVQTIGWNKPRFCEYTCQLFCSSCHTNDTAVLPAKVLHHWDFSLYPVSQMAKAYLDSIQDQPMLCVSAVNPFLFSKVPALLHVMGIRKKIGAMVPYIRCPFRRSVQKSLGIRRYLLESNDFFALWDLVDFSRGAFAVLPIMLDTVSSKILVHITEQCLVCYDSGIPCSARRDCDDPASLIFPFQEAEAEKCPLCGSIFHKPCFVKLMGICPCGKPTVGTRRTTVGPTDRSIMPIGSTFSSGFLSEIFSKARPEKMMRPKNSTPVILMGSLPSTSL